ncbi:MAG: hypothetical protein ABIW30_02675 [Arenimonas sp.]
MTRKAASRDQLFAGSAVAAAGFIILFLWHLPCQRWWPFLQAILWCICLCMGLAGVAGVAGSAGMVEVAGMAGVAGVAGVAGSAAIAMLLAKHSVSATSVVRIFMVNSWFGWIEENRRATGRAIVHEIRLEDFAGTWQFVTAGNRRRKGSSTSHVWLVAHNVTKSGNGLTANPSVFLIRWGEFSERETDNIALPGQAPEQGHRGRDRHAGWLRIGKKRKFLRVKNVKIKVNMYRTGDAFVFLEPPQPISRLKIPISFVGHIGPNIPKTLRRQGMMEESSHFRWCRTHDCGNRHSVKIATRARLGGVGVKMRVYPNNRQVRMNPDQIIYDRNIDRAISSSGQYFRTGMTLQDFLRRSQLFKDRDQAVYA